MKKPVIVDEDALTELFESAAAIYETFNGTSNSKKIAFNLGILIGNIYSLHRTREDYPLIEKKDLKR